MTSSTSGRFVVFEGGEGAGKTTQVERLAQALRDSGHDVLVTREPGGTALGWHLRGLLLTQPMPAKAEALLFLADRVVHVEEVVRPALERGQIVISDRYADSSNVYQGIGRGLGSAHLANLSRWATDRLEPDLVIVLDVDPGVGLARAGRHRGHDRIEREAVEFHDRVRAGFLSGAELGKNHREHLGASTRYLVLDATQPVEVISAEVVSAVAELVNDPCSMALEA